MEKVEEKKEKKYSYKSRISPARQWLPLTLMLFEMLVIFAGGITLIAFFPWVLAIIFVIDFFTVVGIVNSNKSSDYKVSWIIIVVFIPILGFFFCWIFFNRTLTKRQIRKVEKFNNKIEYNDLQENTNLESISKEGEIQAACISKLSSTHLYQNTDIKYLKSGELVFENILEDLKNATEFIFLEFYIIKEGIFWDTVLDILKEKAKQGVEVRVMYDDIGCTHTLPSRYYRSLRKVGIKAIPFNKVQWQPSNKTNNRNHRKILVIDGKIGYTGGFNLGDEYINVHKVAGHWKDVGIRLEGHAVNEFTRLFLLDYALATKNFTINFEKYYKDHRTENKSFCIPFGDGPRLIFKKRVGKISLLNLFSNAKKYVYITTPYLVLDSELVSAIETAAIRGVKVKIITPHIPDRKFMIVMTRSTYFRLLKAGVEIYEYELGFIHAKTYICDDMFAIIGSTNLNYRSMIHSFEDDVWICNDSSINDMKQDFEDTLTKCIKIEKPVKEKFRTKVARCLITIFAPML